MSNYERDPSTVAARYRVKQVGEDEFELCTAQGRSTNLTVRRRGARLDFMTTPRAVNGTLQKIERHSTLCNFLSQN